MMVTFVLGYAANYDEFDVLTHIHGNHSSFKNVKLN